MEQSFLFEYQTGQKQVKNIPDALAIQPTRSLKTVQKQGFHCQYCSKTGIKAIQAKGFTHYSRGIVVCKEKEFKNSSALVYMRFIISSMKFLFFEFSFESPFIISRMALLNMYLYNWPSGVFASFIKENSPQNDNRTFSSFLPLASCIPHSFVLFSTLVWKIK